MPSIRLLALGTALLLAAPAARATDVEALTLPEAVARALARNTTVLAAAADVRRAEALVMEARASALPTLRVNGGYTRLDDARRFQGNTIAAANQLSASAPLTVPLVAPLPWANLARAADARHVAELGVGEVRRQIALAVAYAYLTVLAQQKMVQVTESARAAAEAHATYATQQLEGGRVSRLDVVRAEQQLHVALAQREDARLALSRAREALGVLVAGDRPVDAAAEPTFRPPGADDGLLRLQTRRADLMRMAAARDAAARSTRRDYADYLPYLSGTFLPAYLHPGTIFQPTWTWQIQLNLVVPLYDGGARYGRARERRALLEVTTLTLEHGLRQARSDLRLGREAVTRAGDRLREAEISARLAHQGLEISLQRYSEGATTNLEVIDAERQARDADLEAARAEDALRQARLDLLAASGEFP